MHVIAHGQLNKITKFHRKMRFWLKICNGQTSTVHKSRWVNCPTRVGNLKASTACWRKSARRVELSGNQAAVDRIRRVAVEDLVLSQEDSSISSWDFTRNCHSPYKCAQDNSPWSPTQMLQTMSCSVVVWSQSHPPSHSLINNLTVCNKSCYCSLINRRLNNKTLWW